MKCNLCVVRLLLSSSLTVLLFVAGQVIRSSVVFNSLEQSSSAVQSDESAELKGPVVSYSDLLNVHRSSENQVKNN